MTSRWAKATDAELLAAMRELDDALPKTASDLSLAYCGPFCSDEMPHREYWRRSIANSGGFAAALHSGGTVKP